MPTYILQPRLVFVLRLGSSRRYDDCCARSLGAVPCALVHALQALVRFYFEGRSVTVPLGQRATAHHRPFPGRREMGRCPPGSLVVGYP
jgi:hypothetical protein